MVGSARILNSNWIRILRVIYDISSFMSRNWRLLETGLRFCAHTGRVQDKNAVAVLDRAVLGWIVWFWNGSCSVLGLDFAGAYGNI